MRRTASFAYWLLPPLFCLWLYWYGLRTWFMEDDFAWLGVNARIHDWASFWHAVFVPTQQGTIRPISERLFFIAFWNAFGWQAIYYRALVFLTQFFNLALLSWMIGKLTGSRIAGFLAPILWTANSALAVVMSWTSGYNEVLCATCLLGALGLFLKFQETGKWTYYWFQAVVFILGLGVLELNIVYPAIALCWALARVNAGKVSTNRLALSTVPLFASSAIYYAAHAMAAPRQSTGPYAMHFDTAIPRTLWKYCQWAFVPADWAAVTRLDPRLGLVVCGLLGASLALFTIYEWRRGRYLPAFFVAWFLITLAPLVPLRDHLSDYYLTIPTLGLAALSSMAVAAAWHSSALSKAVAIAGVAVYLAIQIPVARVSTFWHYDRSTRVRDLVLGVVSAHERHPGKTILLADVPQELYTTAIEHKPFLLMTGAGVYLAPESAASARVPEFTLSRGATARALNADTLEVYSAATPRLRNITSLYARAATQEWSSEYPRVLDVANPLLAYAIGEDWYKIEGTFRWMAEKAALRLAGPRSPQERLYLDGYCPKQMFTGGPVYLTVSVDGQSIGRAAIEKPNEQFKQSFPLPGSAIGKTSIEIEVKADRTFREGGDGRPLSFAFGVFEIR